ncbi:cyclic nucleotide-binding/CBS domain-containing protein [Vibrio parahaemolyticus]|nr:cyclic nucleotide-binding/CBS domain-containing protein [Vibrio parahaemolyticus]EHR1013818.1 cyclic nucleotide-binding/CBS domain-containing protein [Vibrio parahaemolyticus]EJG0013350.1 cyclic nucleotide-binding/CBS domain-containing protein [Vibrio parahaemolyticus]EJG1697435.1 cyclic nucleotide-binding/CBS domain-containing protein [Vibrio parahaemolyticus]EJS9799197.1 cyclic nucleotide-binding/CBS domain-containing protein [Vibrio parahaemolyticus]
MEAEQLEVLNFISQHPPFDELPEEQLKKIAIHAEVAYFRQGTDILKFGDTIRDLYMVRSGAVEIYRRKGELYNRIDAGGLFGQMGLLMNNRVRMPAKAIEDTLVYCIPENIFNELCDEFENFADFMELEDSARLRNAISSRSDGNDLTTAKARKILTRDPVTLEATASIQEAASLMAEENVTALLIVRSTEELTEEDDDQLLGILTDRDLCIRVLAQGIDTNISVSEVMSYDVVSLDYNAYVFEAMLTMLRYNVHHLPILKDKKPIGIIGMTDIVRYESQNSLLLVSSIFQQTSVEDLKQVSLQVKDCFVRMVNEDANAHMIGRAMSVIGSSFKQRLAELAEQELGPAPIPYCLVAMGSMARDEQLIVTDQDNALILDDSYDPDKHAEYFAQFAKFVCDGLAACGYTYCTGDIMATNPEWRKTKSQWEECFGDWIDHPTPERLLNSNIFFDLLGIHGRVKWAEQLSSFIVRRAKKNNRFLACMAYNAIRRTPPLGFFKDFVMEKDGRHRNSINLKRRGTAPLADLIRVHALAIGSRSQNSFDRLDDINDAGILPKGRGMDLRDAMELIYMVRIRHQALDIEHGDEPDNNIEPENMSDFERRNLKAAFQILSNAQNFIKFRYQRSSK